MVASAERLGWTVCSAVYLITDTGGSLNLRLDPPVVIEKKVCEAVKRWRWKRVASKQVHIKHSSNSVQFEPARKMLNATKLEDQSVDMTKQHSGGL